jgi:urea transport system permease protein
MRPLLLALAFVALALPFAARAQSPDLAAVIAESRAEIEKPSRQSVGPLVEAIAATGPQGAAVLQAWAERLLGLRKSDGLVVIATPQGDSLTLTDAATGADLGTVPEGDVTLLRPNSGVRGVISAALAGNALSDPDPSVGPRRWIRCRAAPMRASLNCCVGRWTIPTRRWPPASSGSSGC